MEKWKRHVSQWRKKVVKSPSPEQLNRLAARLKTDFDSMEKEVNSMKLTEFDLGDVGAIILATAIEPNQSITQLDLGFNSIGAKGIVSIAHILRGNGTLRELCLSGNSVLPQGSQALGAALSNGLSNLKTLYLAGCGIGTEGVGHIADCLEGRQGGAGCRSLRNLYLGSNKIGCSGVRVLSRALLHLHDLGVCKTSSFQLFLSENNIGSLGAESLAVVLERTQVLGYLELSINRVGSNGATALSSGLACNKSLHFLQVQHSPPLPHIDMYLYIHIYIPIYIHIYILYIYVFIAFIK
jgi:Ran GTPase-activating protein (RanGAP) involved in mRNA processing and transport